VAIGGRELDEHIDNWVTRGVISADQAAAIRQIEAPERSHGPAREILAYLGAVLVVAAGFILVSEFWEDVGKPARILLSLSAGVLLAVAGIALTRSEGASTRRAGQAALLLGAAPIGYALGMIIDAVVEDEEISVTVGFAAALAYSAFFYARDRSFAQHVGIFISATGTAVALGMLVEGDAGSWIIGMLLVVLGVAWIGSSATNRLPPRVLGEIGGLIDVGIGSLIIVGSLGPDDGGGVGAMIAWIVVAIALVASGVRWDEVVLIIGGVIGLLVYIPWLATEVLGEGVGAPLALLIAGGLLIGTALYLTRRSRRAAELPPGEAR
jgi:uncharacterized membrane protein